LGFYERTIEDGETTMGIGDVVDEFLNRHGPGAYEDAFSFEYQDVLVRSRSRRFDRRSVLGVHGTGLVMGRDHGGRGLAWY
jgi:hypothetical protein